MDDEVVAAAISRIDTNIESMKGAIEEMKSNCTRTESSRGGDIKDLYEKINKLGAGLYKTTSGLALKTENHQGRLDTHDRYFGYVAAILVGIIIAVAAAVLIGRM